MNLLETNSTKSPTPKNTRRLNPILVSFEAKKEDLNKYKQHLEETCPDSIKSINFDKKGKLLIIPANNIESIQNILTKAFPQYEKINLNDNKFQKQLL